VRLWNTVPQTLPKFVKGRDRIGEKLILAVVLVTSGGASCTSATDRRSERRTSTTGRKGLVDELMKEAAGLALQEFENFLNIRCQPGRFAG